MAPETSHAKFCLKLPDIHHNNTGGLVKVPNSNYRSDNGFIGFPA